MRGEQKRIRPRACRSAGSPPHARGAEAWSGARDHPRGITPACAGSRRCRRGTVCRSRDHPRMRGEQGGSTTTGGCRLGSPPHARGAVGCVGGEQEVVGITPACAGSSRCRPARPYSPRDHPRMRGEQLVFGIVMSMLAGSPPHARGAVFTRFAYRRLLGITPACAGSRECTQPGAGCYRDHPRMRGEQLTGTPCDWCAMGSPPHARGAGRTAPPFGDHTLDHPRMRGEQGDPDDRTGE